MLNNPNEWHNIEEEAEETAPEEFVVDPVAPATPNPNNLNVKYVKIGLLVFALFLIVGIAIAKKMGESSTQLASLPPTPGQAGNMTAPPMDNSKMAVVNVDLNSNPSQVPPTPSAPNAPTQITVNPALQAQGPKTPGGDLVVPNKQVGPTAGFIDPQKSTVIVPVGNSGRSNPFMPFSGASSAIKHLSASAIPTLPKNSVYVNDTNFDVVAPPSAMKPDVQATKLMQTTISGIMYDSRSPSAIIKVNGQDQLVRRNDRVAGYTVLDITRDKVVVKSGANVYKASVGQSISTAGVNINPVNNITHKFGGAYRPVRGKSIVISSY